MMIKSKRFWFLRNWYAWVVLALGAATAIFIRQPWIVALGIIGYLLILLFEAGLDPTSLVRMLYVEQENRSMQAEHGRLVGGIKDLQAQNQALVAENLRLNRDLELAKAELEGLKRRPRKTSGPSGTQNAEGE